MEKNLTSSARRARSTQKLLAIWGAKKRVDFKVLKWTLFFAPQMAKYLKKIKIQIHRAMPFAMNLKYK